MSGDIDKIRATALRITELSCGLTPAEWMVALAGATASSIATMFPDDIDGACATNASQVLRAARLMAPTEQ